MSKKKRNKQYKGSVSTRPVVTRVSAVNRNRVHQWWVDHERIRKPLLIAIGIGLAIIVIVIGIIGAIW